MPWTASATASSASRTCRRRRASRLRLRPSLPYHGSPCSCCAGATSSGIRNMVEPSSIEQSIRTGLACTHLEVSGDGAHFEAVVVSPAFAGLNRVRQHQLVYAALGDRMRQEIHALSMKAYSPEEWAAR